MDERHVVPVDWWVLHELSETCACDPCVLVDDDDVLVVHHRLAVPQP